MTKLFSLIYNDQVHLAPGKKVLAPEEYQALLSAEELQKKMEEELARKKQEDADDAAAAKQEAINQGFKEGLDTWAQQLAQFEKTVQGIQADMETNIVPVAIKAAEKIVGRALAEKPEVLAEIVKQQLKAVAEHRRFTLYVNPKDLALFEKEKPLLKQGVDSAESFNIVAREEIAPETCTIETEAGIINVNLEELWKALEAAFQHLLSS